MKQFSEHFLAKFASWFMRRKNIQALTQPASNRLLKNPGSGLSQPGSDQILDEVDCIT